MSRIQLTRKALEYWKTWLLFMSTVEQEAILRLKEAKARRLSSLAPGESLGSQQNTPKLHVHLAH